MDEREFTPVSSQKTKISINPNITFHIDQEIINSVCLPIQVDIGWHEVTDKPKDRWKFRTSSLRNVAITPPYMHDGGFATLEEAIDFYNQGGSGHSMQDKRILPINLLNQEKIDLKNFLKSHTSSELNCLIAETRSADLDNQCTQIFSKSV